MATRPPLTHGADEWTVVRLSQIDADLRRTVAHELARYWKLQGLQYALWMLRVTAPTAEQDVALAVPAEKARLVAAGKRPTGSLEAELKLRPMEFVR
jgi:hypothetical protein